MIEPEKLFEHSSKFFSEEANKILLRLSKSKSKKQTDKHLIELQQIKKRIKLELEMLNKFLDEDGEDFS